MTVTLLPGDCLALLPTLPAASVDLILADLPYGTTSCHWDSVIPLDKLWAEYKRVLKPRGAVVLTASQPFTSTLVLSNPKWFRYEWVWEKDRATGHLDAKRKPLKAHESVLVFGPRLPKYNPQITYGHKPGNARGRDLASGHIRELIRGGIARNTNPGYTTRFPRTVLKINVPNGDERGLHPTQKPVALFSYLIRTYSNPGDLVLDSCAGSGTTGVAAIETGRDAILIERDPAYCAIIARRLAAAQPALLQEAS